MKFVCPDCGFESTDPGNCPTCETPLLKREDEGLTEAEGIEKDLDDESEGDTEGEGDEGW